MRPALLNRILIVLGFVGLFIAGVLSLSHYRGIVPPCGVAAECEKVTTHPSAFWMGQPVAYFGLLGYILLTGLAIVRSLRGLDRTRPLVMLGYVVAAVGTVLSLYLQYVSLVEIGAKCPYCIASAVTMIATLIGYALLAQSLQGGEAPTRSRGDFVLAGGLAMTLVLALTVQGFVQKGKQSRSTPVVTVPKNLSLIPERPNLFGEEKAPITIVEFADVCCGACRVSSPKVKEFVNRSKGKVRLIYRHFPLIQRHRMALPGAFGCEYAAEKGRFWEYLSAIMARPEPPATPEEMTMEDVTAAAESVGLDKAELERRLGDKKDPIYERIAADMQVCDRLGVVVTPTFFIIAPGQQPRLTTSDTVFEVLEEPTYRNIIEGKASG